MSNFLKRTITGFFFIVIVIASIVVSEHSTAVLFFLISIMGTAELFRMIRNSKTKPQIVNAYILAIGFFILSYLERTFIPDMNSAIFLYPMITLIAITELFKNSMRPIFNIATTIFAAFYVTLPFVILLKVGYFGYYAFSQEFNYKILLGYFIILWASDTGAYLAGSAFGKTPLFKRISPKKTIEGTIGGAVLAVIFAILYGKLFNYLHSTDWIALAVIIVVFGSFGDLVESMFKRSVNVKESGKTLPGHGGFLDRFDGVLTSAPMVYVYLELISKN